MLAASQSHSPSHVELVVPFNPAESHLRDARLEPLWLTGFKSVPKLFPGLERRIALCPRAEWLLGLIPRVAVHRGRSSVSGRDDVFGRIGQGLLPPVRRSEAAGRAKRSSQVGAHGARLVEAEPVAVGIFQIPRGKEFSGTLPVLWPLGLSGGAHEILIMPISLFVMGNEERAPPCPHRHKCRPR